MFSFLSYHNFCKFIVAATKLTRRAGGHISFLEFERDEKDQTRVSDKELRDRVRAQLDDFRRSSPLRLTGDVFSFIIRR